jgi:hypothetical protein
MVKLSREGNWGRRFEECRGLDLKKGNAKKASVEMKNVKKCQLFKSMPSKGNEFFGDFKRNRMNEEIGRKKMVTKVKRNASSSRN